MSVFSSFCMALSRSGREAGRSISISIYRDDGILMSDNAGEHTSEANNLIIENGALVKDCKKRLREIEKPYPKPFMSKASWLLRPNSTSFWLYDSSSDQRHRAGRFFPYGRNDPERPRLNEGCSFIPPAPLENQVKEELSSIMKAFDAVEIAIEAIFYVVKS